MSGRARARNPQRRTWDDRGGPDGDLCPARPLFPHAEGCPGWGWVGKRAAPDVVRCDECATFDDDEDADEHVRGCLVCLAELAELGAGHRAPGDPAHLHARALRELWAFWANGLGSQRRPRGMPSSALPILRPDSRVEDLATWCQKVDPNGEWLRALAAAKGQPGVTEFGEDLDELERACWTQIGEWYEQDGPH